MYDADEHVVNYVARARERPHYLIDHLPDGVREGQGPIQIRLRQSP